MTSDPTGRNCAVHQARRVEVTAVTDPIPDPPAAPGRSIPAPPAWTPAAPVDDAGPGAGPPLPPAPPLVAPAPVSLRGYPPDAHTHARAHRDEPGRGDAPPPDTPWASGAPQTPLAAPSGTRRRGSAGSTGTMLVRAVLQFAALTAVLVTAGGAVVTVADAITGRGVVGGWLPWVVLLAATITAYRITLDRYFLSSPTAAAAPGAAARDADPCHPDQPGRVRG